MKKYLFSIFFLIVSLPLFAQLPKLKWAKGLGGKGSENTSFIEIDQLGNVIIVGRYGDTVDFDLGVGKYLLNSTFKYGALFILKLDSSGNFLWVDELKGEGFAVPNNLVLDKDGNIYITGSLMDTVDFDPSNTIFNLKSNGKKTFRDDAFIAKYNKAGAFVWAKQISGPGSEEGLSIAVDKQGNVYTCGSFTDSIDANPGVGKYFLRSKDMDDVFITKLDKLGNFVWSKSFGSEWQDEANCITVDDSGYIYVSGKFSDPIFIAIDNRIDTLKCKGGSDVFILKLDAKANYVWIKSIGGPLADYMVTMKIDDSSNIFLNGIFQSYTEVDPGPDTAYLLSHGSLDIFLVKLNKHGKFKGALSIGGEDYERATDLDLDKHGNIFLTGEFRGEMDFDPGPKVFYSAPKGYQDIFVLKLDSTGKFIWEFDITGSANESSSSFTMDKLGNIYLSGTIFSSVDCEPGIGTYTVNPIGGSDILICKFKDREPLVSIQDGFIKSPMKIFPNPNQGNFAIEITNPEKDISIEIYNQLGEKVKEVDAQSSQTYYEVNENFVSGIYIVRVKNGGTYFNQKIIVVK